MSPNLDHYSTLEVERTATQQELTASYRRLALIHHPDKNPDNVEAATAAFQKIQQAYETLSDSAKRSGYDARTSKGPKRAPPGSSNARDREPFTHHAPPMADFFRAGPMFGFGFGYHYTGQSSYESREEAEREYEFQERAARRAAWERERTEWKWANEQRRARDKAEAEAKKAKNEAKKAEKEAKSTEKDNQRATEKKKQEAHWEMLNARTRNEKLAACLHSEFCTKAQQRQKFKCGACHVKRGITSFECPHCSLSICQQCVIDFAKKRAAAQVRPAAKPEPVVEPEPAAQPQAEPDNNTNNENTTNQKSKGPRPGSRKTRCYTCNKFGHVAKNCRSRKGDQP
ncbi:DnaJ-domain-containing protein [Hypoxylon crocopeplum]|nr:DnaJ-domain-containing protein [Hypoxylon crocopeplum]